MRSLVVAATAALMLLLLAAYSNAALYASPLIEPTAAVTPVIFVVPHGDEGAFDRLIEALEVLSSGGYRPGYNCVKASGVPGLADALRRVVSKTGMRCHVVGLGDSNDVVHDLLLRYEEGFVQEHVQSWICSYWPRPPSHLPETMRVYFMLPRGAEGMYSRLLRADPVNRSLRLLPPQRPPAEAAAMPPYRNALLGVVLANHGHSAAGTANDLSTKIPSTRTELLFDTAAPGGCKCSTDVYHYREGRRTLCWADCDGPAAAGGVGLGYRSWASKSCNSLDYVLDLPRHYVDGEQACTIYQNEFNGNLHGSSGGCKVLCQEDASGRLFVAPYVGGNTDWRTEDAREACPPGSACA